MQPNHPPRSGPRTSRRSRSLTYVALCAALAALTVEGCVYYHAVPASYGSAAFDRSWDAALGAARDVGIEISAADRTSGVIYGTSPDGQVTIHVFTQADGNVRVEFNASGVPGLADRLSSAYARRMGR